MGGADAILEVTKIHEPDSAAPVIHLGHPVMLSNLPSMQKLRKLDLTDNFFNGVLSTTAGKLRELEELRLDINQVGHASSISALGIKAMPKNQRLNRPFRELRLPPFLGACRRPRRVKHGFALSCPGV